jgi:hypothetical protein
MKFIIGFSRVGKSTLSKKISQHPISASGWIKELLPQDDSESLSEYRSRITEASLAKRKQDRNICIRWLKNQSGDLIEGLRDPFDFVNIFDFSADEVHIIYGGDPANHYDLGVLVIREYIDHLIRIGLLQEERVFRYDFEETPHSCSVTPRFSLGG